MKITKQMQYWRGEHGRKYTERSVQTLEDMQSDYKRKYGIMPEQMYLPFFELLDRSSRILEVGCNMGRQLLLLQSIGFKCLYGVELLPYPIEKAKSMTRGINIIQASFYEIPFKEGSFDLVFTAGILIQVAPSDINKLLDEIYRVSRQYIWGLEYYSDHHTELPYREYDDFLWKRSFANLYLENFGNLKLVKEERVKYLENDNVDSIYLLEKT